MKAIIKILLTIKLMLSSISYVIDVIRVNIKLNRLDNDTVNDFEKACL
jgi:hypothetical protein